MSLSLPLVFLILFGGFLTLLGFLALAVTKVVAPEGGHARGVLGGLAALFALLFFGFLGLMGLGIYAASVGVSTAMEENPIQEIEIHRGPGAFEEHSGDGVPPGLQAFLSVEGNAGPRVAEYLDQVLDMDEDELDRHLRLHEEVQPDTDVFELRLPVSECEMKSLERDLERELGLDVDLPHGLRVRMGRQ